MNPLPPNADELVSAYLDGQAAPAEVVTVESSPELMARVEALREVATQVGSPVAPAAEQKEAHLAAALGAFDALFAADEPSTPNAPPTEVQPSVVSLDVARERRRPRRFNSGVIAAAAAALLLIVGFTALSLGRGGSSQSDVASDVSEAVESSADAVSDSADDAMDDDTSAESFGGLSETEASASSANLQPAATAAPQPAQAAPAEDTSAAMEEEAMEDEEAVEESADEAEESMADSGDVDTEPLVEVDGLDLEITPFFFGEFDDIDALAAALTDLSRSDLEQRKGSIGQGIFARCQSLIPELSAVDTPTLIGDASVDGQPREVHALGADASVDGETVFYIVDPTDDCSTVATFP